MYSNKANLIQIYFLCYFQKNFKIDEEVYRKLGVTTSVHEFI